MIAFLVNNAALIEILGLIRREQIAFQPILRAPRGQDLPAALSDHRHVAKVAARLLFGFFACHAFLHELLGTFLEVLPDRDS